MRKPFGMERFLFYTNKFFFLLCAWGLDECVFTFSVLSMHLFVASWVDWIAPCVAVGVDHSRQGSGQPQSELWDGVPSTRSPAHGTQGTIMGLWHWGKTIQDGSLTLVEFNVINIQTLLGYEPIIARIATIIATSSAGRMGPYYGESKLHGATSDLSSLHDGAVPLNSKITL